MPAVSIRHRTTYRYRNPVGFGEHRMMLRPMEGPDQRLVAYNLDISPEPSRLTHHQDATDAWVGLARFATRADVLDVASRAVVDHQPLSSAACDGSDAKLGAGGFVYDDSEVAVLAASRQRRYPDSAEVEAWARRFLRRVGRTRAGTVLSEMTHSLRSSLDYQVRLTGPPQPPDVTLAEGGSCRDFAVLMIEGARALGLAARFVSGYVYGKGAASAGEKRGHTHAWVRVYLPDCGWVDFDPTNGIVGNEGLIRVAVAADPRLVLPLHGSWRGLRSDFLGMDVSVEIDVAEAAIGQPPLPLRVAETG